MADFTKIEASTVELENQVRQMVDAMNAFQKTEVTIGTTRLRPTATQKTAIRTQYTDALAAAEAAIADIKTELRN